MCVINLSRLVVAVLDPIQSLMLPERGRSMLEFTGLPAFPFRSGGMMGWVSCADTLPKIDMVTIASSGGFTPQQRMNAVRLNCITALAVGKNTSTNTQWVFRLEAEIDHDDTRPRSADD